MNARFGCTLPNDPALIANCKACTEIGEFNEALKEYQKEGYEQFLDMSARIKEETVRNLFLVKIAKEEDLERLAPRHEQEIVLSHGSDGADSGKKTVRRQAEKIGRNSPCPCGSGKKYKKCCGKAA